MFKPLRLPSILPATTRRRTPSRTYSPSTGSAPYHHADFGAELTALGHVVPTQSASLPLDTAEATEGPLLIKTVPSLRVILESDIEQAMWEAEQGDVRDGMQVEKGLCGEVEGRYGGERRDKRWPLLRLPSAILPDQSAHAPTTTSTQNKRAHTPWWDENGVEGAVRMVEFPRRAGAEGEREVALA
ncbi:hypothetical protein HDV00_002082 [Rhizophlyctis rosea]|nr:hypothetical protein HDV00_002082 [Rhizophlyctis rosea]